MISSIFPKSARLWRARSPRPLNRFQKTIPFLVCTLRELSIALCFATRSWVWRYDPSRWKPEIFGFWHAPAYASLRSASEGSDVASGWCAQRKSWIQFASTIRHGIHTTSNVRRPPQSARQNAAGSQWVGSQSVQPLVTRMLNTMPVEIELFLSVLWPRSHFIVYADSEENLDPPRYSAMM